MTETNLRSEKPSSLLLLIVDVLLSARYRLLIMFIALISLLAVLAQTIFQTVLLANKPYGHTLNNCNSLSPVTGHSSLLL